MQTNLDRRRINDIGRSVAILSGASLIFLGMLRPKRSTLVAASGGLGLMILGISGETVFERFLSSLGKQAVYEKVHLERTLKIARPREEIYRFWRDFAKLPRIIRSLDSVTVMSPEKSHWIVIGPNGNKVEWDLKMDRDEDGQELSWHTLSGSEINHWGKVEFRDSISKDGTEVHIDLHFTPNSTHGLTRIFGPDPESEILYVLNNMKAYLETGELPQKEEGGSGQGKSREKQIDVVKEASEESFPASDAPGWIKSSVGDQ